MFIYNVTIQLSWQIHEQWLLWMQQEHMAEVINTGCFTNYQLLRLIEIDETEGPTYAAQYYAPSKAMYNQYITTHAETLRKKSFKKWGNQFIAFRSIMQVVQ